MKKSLLQLLALFVSISFTSCNNDDASTSVELTNNGIFQAIIDDAMVEDFLENYAYNDIEMEADPSKTDQDIVFYKVSEGAIGGVTSGTSLLDSDKLEDYSYTYTDDYGFEVTQPYYVITIREGEGKPISEVGRVNLTYQTKVILKDTGSSNTRLLETNKQNLDSLTEPTWFTNSQFITGFNQALSKFKTAKLTDDDPCSIVDIDGNGTITSGNNDFGIGIVIMPSGLGYFEGAFYFNNYVDNDVDGEVDDAEVEDNFGYRNLILTFSTYNAFDLDMDGDVIPSLLEDLNGDGDLDNDDIDLDEIPNYLDTDDDGDGILTINEIFIGDKDLIDEYGEAIEFDEASATDSDCDGIYTNDNDVHFLYTADDGKVLYIVPGENEDLIVGKTPYHLDALFLFEE